jgi:hypothetical protein
MLNISRRVALAAALTLAGLGAAYADDVVYTAKLDGAAETPPNDTKGTGAVDAHFDTATKTLTWTVTYSGLTGPATMAHFHGPAPEGKAAPVMVPIKDSLASPIKGSATLSDDQAKALTDGMIYFNIHTDAHKSGEVRGQLKAGM